MKKKIKPLLIILISFFSVCAITLGSVFLIFAGSIDYLYYNMTSPNLKIEAPKWNGETYLDVQYSKVSETDKLDLYVPSVEENQKPPLLILIHGGGFFYNDSRSRQAKFMYQEFRSKGIACASINYRLAQEAIYPAAVNDCKAAIKYLIAHQDEYKYDASKIIVWGESAGGYLASLISVCNQNEYNEVPYIGQEVYGDIDVSVDGLIDFYGIHDFDLYDSDYKELGVSKNLLKTVGSYNQSNSKESFMSLFIGKTINECEELEKEELSISKRISNRSDNSKLNIYLTHGSMDITVPITQTIRIYETCKEELSINVIYNEMKNYKHADDRFYTSEALKPVYSFIKCIIEK